MRKTQTVSEEHTIVATWRVYGLGVGGWGVLRVVWGVRVGGGDEVVGRSVGGIGVGARI